MVNNDYDAQFDAAGKFYNVDPQLLKTIFHVESGGNPNAPRGSSGEIGPMQFMPGTANQLHLQDPTDMSQAIPAAAQIIRRGLDDNGGNVAAALQTYNGGAGGPNNPKTIQYVQRAAQLYPQMGLKTQAQPDDVADLGDSIVKGESQSVASSAKPDPEADLGASIIAKSAPVPAPATAPVAAPATTGAQPAAAPSVGPTDLTAPPPPNPQTGQVDTIAPMARNLISQTPGYSYGNVLPMKQNNATGQLSPAMPGMLTNFLNGGLDLAEGPITGAVTPQATMTLGNLMTGAPQRFGGAATASTVAPDAAAAMAAQGAKEGAQSGILGRQFQGAPTTPNYNPTTPAGPASPIPGMKLDASSIPNADPDSAQTSKFVQMLHTTIADKIAHTAGMYVGHTFGSLPGAAFGFYVAPMIKNVIANYGPQVGAAVSKALAKSTGVLAAPYAAPQQNKLQLPPGQQPLA